MKRLFGLLATLSLLAPMSMVSAQAQTFNPQKFSNATGSAGNATYQTGVAPGNLPIHLGGNATGKQSPFGGVGGVVNSLIFGTQGVTGGQYQMTLAPKFGGGTGQWRNGLPPTMLDSFVSESGGFAEWIYGDEGTDSIPPISSSPGDMTGFSKASRIQTGISFSEDDAGLTTGHVSALPDAAGADEFLQYMPDPSTGFARPEEWDMSGPLMGAQPVPQTPNGSLGSLINNIGNLINGGP
jgi:hypothetical protein